MHATSDALLCALGLTQARELFDLEAIMGFVTCHFGRLLFADDSSRAFIEDGQFILDQDGQIMGASPSNQHLIETALGASAPIRFLLVSSQSSDYALCSLTPYAAARLWRVRRVEAETPPVSVGFERAFNLTPSEASLCRLLISSGKEVDIAKALSLSPETVRTHRKRIYMKLGVTERAELIRLAWRLSDGF